MLGPRILAYFIFDGTGAEIGRYILRNYLRNNTARASVVMQQENKESVIMNCGKLHQRYGVSYKER